ncbi:MAG: dihydroxyacetone kinase subunit DhaL [Oscillospiraceae bacterium]|nr:dihydroxyacetone kinase subunit DhaL [Oscillospiraceae bacterium]
MSTLNQGHVELIVRTMAETAISNEAYFSELDAVMGDADFGASLAGGFKAVLGAWDGYDHSTISGLLLNVASSITGNTGGCSGPVWGTLFMRCGMSFRNKSELSIDDIIGGLKNAIEGISKRGGAVVGDKTLLDALNEIVVSLEASAAAGAPMLDAFRAASDAAVQCRETTKGWIAKRGRQSFTGERSIGTLDPGIVAVGDMTVAIMAALNGKL